METMNFGTLPIFDREDGTTIGRKPIEWAIVNEHEHVYIDKHGVTHKGKNYHLVSIEQLTILTKDEIELKCIKTSSKETNKYAFDGDSIMHTIFDCKETEQIVMAKSHAYAGANVIEKTGLVRLAGLILEAVNAHFNCLKSSLYEDGLPSVVYCCYGVIKLLTSDGKIHPYYWSDSEKKFWTPDASAPEYPAKRFYFGVNLATTVFVEE